MSTGSSSITTNAPCAAHVIAGEAGVLLANTAMDTINPATCRVHVPPASAQRVLTELRRNGYLADLADLAEDEECTVELGQR